jgi:hypothetical protein
MKFDDVDSDKHINSYSPDERRQLMIERLQTIVESKSGWFNQAEYKNKRTKVTFKCNEGHEWRTQAQTVLNGSWCRSCWEKNKAGKHLKLDGLAQANEIAIARKGRCLSVEYTTARSPLHWSCINKHEWFAALSDIKKGTWCPDCSGGVRERLCRYYIEELTQFKFPKAKPTWLINARGNLMELDGYCEEFAMAFEHQGEQHYRAIDHFNRRDETLVQRQEDDQKKRDLCKLNGVDLIEIPFDVDGNDLHEWIKNYISNVRPSLALSDDVERKNYVPSNELSELKEVARNKGGDCLSDVYQGIQGSHEFSCSEGHMWTTTASVIKQGGWCPVCKLKVLADKQRIHSVDSMQAIAEQRGGKFLSTTFNSVNDRYRWSCAANHEWTAAPSDVMKGTWCGSCAKDKYRVTLDVAHSAALQHEGKCLSAEVKDSYSKLKWLCKNGHTWEARLNNVMHKNSWCPQCSKNKVSDDAWSANYKVLVEFLKFQKIEAVKSETVFNGVALGRWMEQQRKAFKTGALKEEKLMQLELIGWISDLKDLQWNSTYELLKKYVQQNGTSQVPQSTVYSGVSLGIWVATQRRRYKGKKLLGKRKALLESLAGWSWHVVQ